MTFGLVIVTLKASAVSEEYAQFPDVQSTDVI